MKVEKKSLEAMFSTAVASEEVVDDIGVKTSVPEPVQEVKVVQPTIKPITQVEQKQVEPAIFSSVISLEQVKQVILLTETYNKLEKPVQIALQRITQANADDIVPSTIYGIINMKKQEKDGITNLTTLKKMARQERAFKLMQLADNELIGVQNQLRSLHSRYEEKDLKDMDRISFCIYLENTIDSMDDRTLQLFEPISNILSLVEG